MNEPAARASEPRYRLARGIRLRWDKDAEPLLLVPEGIITLNEPAAAVLEALGEGKSVDEIAALLRERFEDPDGVMNAEVCTMLEDFTSAGFVRR